MRFKVWLEADYPVPPFEIKPEIDWDSFVTKDLIDDTKKMLQENPYDEQHRRATLQWLKKEFDEVVSSADCFKNTTDIWAKVWNWYEENDPSDEWEEHSEEYFESVFDPNIAIEAIWAVATSGL